MAKSSGGALGGRPSGEGSSWSEGYDDAAASRLFEGGLPLFQPAIYRLLLREEIKRWKRYGVRFSMIMLALNGPSPKEAGEIENKLVKLVRSALREVDQIGRYGRNLYLVTLPATDSEDAALVLKRLLVLARDQDGIEMEGAILPGFEEGEMERVLAETARSLQGAQA